MIGPGIRNSPGPLILPRTAAGVATIAPGATGEFQDFVIPTQGCSQLSVSWFADQAGTFRVYKRIPGAVITNSGTTGFRLAKPETVQAAASTEEQIERIDAAVEPGAYFRCMFVVSGGAGAPANVSASVAYKTRV